MLIHFAFSSLGKQGNIEEQTLRVIDSILKEKRLLVSPCKEFIPSYPKKGEKIIPMEMFKVTAPGEASVTFNLKEDPDWLGKLPDDTTIHYHPMDVYMICFIKISLSQLKNSTHSAEYGKFGLAFTDEFLMGKGISPVFYYTEESLWHDALLKKWNYNQSLMSAKDKANLEKEILSYRKPATLFPSFKKSVVMKITTVNQETRLEYLTYDRYPDNYDFTKEKEHRIIFDKGIDYLHFGEDDLFMVIVPDLKAQEEVELFFEHNWSKQPKVELYPHWSYGGTQTQPACSGKYQNFA